MNYQDMDESTQSQTHHEVNSRSVELKSIHRNLILSVGQSLIFLNFAGTLAVLVYRYLLNGSAAMNHMNISLFSFTFGIVSIAMALMFLFMRTQKVVSSYAVDRDLFLNNQLSIDEVRQNDAEHSESDNFEFILILFSFIAFISGVLYGVFNFV
ncbi:MAG: hypothetical protein OQK78_09215 [Gammaproteobacteria bacterium]|nr:hypothetical protein [Gammaproteobacteria bacterium]